MEPISLADAVDWMDGTLSASSSEGLIQSVCTDSRRALEGALFVALKGERVDGHEFVRDAIEHGALAVVVDRVGTDSSGPAVFVRVPDTLKALGDLAAGYHRFMQNKKKHIGLVAVTGSAGKTTTKEMIGCIISAATPCRVAPESFNNEIGVPLTILGLEKCHKALVLEFAARKAGDITRLCQIAPPDVGVITNIGKAHLGLFGSVDAIAEAKGELLDGMCSEGTSVLNADDAFFSQLYRCVKGDAVSFAIERDADLQALDIRCKGGETIFDLKIPSLGDTLMPVCLPMFGIHNVYNALAAIAGAWGLGIEPCFSSDALRQFSPPKMRMEIRSGSEGSTVINDAYNANPSSMSVALSVLQQAECSGRRIVVLGEMLELGSFSEEEHRAVGRACVANGVDVVIGVGDAVWPLVDVVQSSGSICVYHVADAEMACSLAHETVSPGDVVLVKASRAVGLDQVAHSLCADVCTMD